MNGIEELAPEGYFKKEDDMELLDEVTAEIKELPIRYKLLITGDWHLDYKQPKNRMDDYVKAQKEKMTWIFDLALGEDIDYILQPGDFFNSHKMPDHVKTYWINFFKNYDIPILTVPGQHDMRYHSSDLKDTPMGVLEAAGAIDILGPNAMCFESAKSSTLQHYVVKIYGAGWEQDIPRPDVSGFPEMSINILVMHKMVALKSQWPGHLFTPASSILDEYRFDLIVSGDNHKWFYTHSNGKSLINCGSLMRSAIDQFDHEPIVYIYNTEARTIQPHPVPIKPFEDVMNLKAVEKEKKRNKELEAFVDGVSESNVEGLDFKKNLIDHLKNHKETIGEGVIKIIDEVVG